MIVGNRHTFAIEAEVTDVVDGWVLGRFRFWLGGAEVGNWDDAADLAGCVRWLDVFSSVRRNRHEPVLEALSADEVIQLLWDDFMNPDIPAGRSELGIHDVYERFHISNLGMSSFDAFDLLLLVRDDGSERCIWRNARTRAISECDLAADEMEKVAAEFCREFRRSMQVPSSNG